MRTPSKLREQEEILARYESHDADSDFFGWRRDVLLHTMEFELIRHHLVSGVKKEQWKKVRRTSVMEIEREAKNCYEYALSKIREHRSNSATRSVEKLQEYAWLLGRDDVVAAMDEVDYTQYGAPKVRAWGTGFGVRWPNTVWAVSMSKGLPCSPKCRSGCLL